MTLILPPNLNTSDNSTFLLVDFSQNWQHFPRPESGFAVHEGQAINDAVLRVVEVGEKNTKFQAPNFDCRHPTVPGKFVLFFFFPVFAVKKFCQPGGVYKKQVSSQSHFWCRGGFYWGELFSKKLQETAKAATWFWARTMSMTFSWTFLAWKTSSCVMDASTGFLGYEIGQWVNLLVGG